MDDAPKTRKTPSQQGLRAQREAAGITAAYIRELANGRTRRRTQPPRRELPQPIRASLQEGGTH